MLWIENIVGSTLTPPFLSILALIWLNLWILTMWLLENVHFQPFQRHEMKVNLKKKKTRKTVKKIKGKIKLIISNLNCTLLILNPQFRPQALGHTHCTLGKKMFF